MLCQPLRIGDRDALSFSHLHLRRLSASLPQFPIWEPLATTRQRAWGHPTFVGSARARDRRKLRTSFGWRARRYAASLTELAESLTERHTHKSHEENIQ